MKLLLFLFIFSTAIFVSCKSNSHEPMDTSAVMASDTASVKYLCPMKCQKDTAYVMAGICPVCKMDLEKVVAQQ